MTTVYAIGVRPSAGSLVSGRRVLYTQCPGHRSFLSSKVFASFFSISATQESLLSPTRHNGAVRSSSSVRPFRSGQTTVTLPYLHSRRTFSAAQDKHPTMPPRRQLAYIALGSNIGNRLENIEQACRILANHPNFHLRRTSSLYETVPMYVEDQGHFINGVCEVMLPI